MDESDNATQPCPHDGSNTMIQDQANAQFKAEGYSQTSLVIEILGPGRVEGNATWWLVKAYNLRRASAFERVLTAMQQRDPTIGDEWNNVLMQYEGQSGETRYMLRYICP